MFFSLEIISKSDGPPWMCALHAYKIVSVRIIFNKSKRTNRNASSPSPHRRLSGAAAVQAAPSVMTVPLARVAWRRVITATAPSSEHLIYIFLSITSRAWEQDLCHCLVLPSQKKRQKEKSGMNFFMQLFPFLHPRSCRNSGSRMEVVGKA